MLNTEERNDILNHIEKEWDIGITKLSENEYKEHRRRMNELVGKKDPNIIYLSPSKASIFMDAGRGIIQLHGMCHRAIFFASINTASTNPPSKQAKRKMFTGKLIEKAEHEIEKLSNIFVSNNQIISYKIDEQTMIHAELDSILRDQNSKNFVKEVKSVFGYNAVRDHVTGSKNKPPYPRISAIMQTMLYISILGIKYGLLKYIDGTSMYDEKDFIVEAEPIMAGNEMVDQVAVIDGQVNGSIRMSNIMARYIQLAHYLRTRALPPRECVLEYTDETVAKMYELSLITKNAYTCHGTGERKVGDWQCRLCYHKDLCYSDTEVVNSVVKKAVEDLEKKGDTIEASGEVNIVW